MDNEVRSSALKGTLSEIAKACPDVTSAFIFKENGDIITGDGKTPEETAVHAVDGLESILEKATAIDGLEAVVVEGENGRVHVSHMDNFYLVTATSKEADVDYVNSFTQALVPAVLRVLERFSPNTLSNSLPELDSHAEAEVKTELENSVTEQNQTFEEEKAEELRTDERREQPESQPDTERIIPEVQVNQFIVENLGGLLAPSDTVRIDNESLSQWKELYDNADIEEAIVETFGGKSSRCKLKPIKDAKFQGKGIIQIPEKIQEALEIRKGELVRVKPVVE